MPLDAMSFDYALHTLAPSNLLHEARRVVAKHWRRIRRVDQRVVVLEPRGLAAGASPRGEILISYILDPFLVPDGHPLPHSHTHFWESRAIGEIWRDLGYRVTAISWTNARYLPDRDFDIVLDVRLNLERLAPLLPGALKILHTDTSHVRFNNRAQQERLEALQKRRGAKIRPVKMLPLNQAPDVADVITYLGNDFTASTYAFADKPMVRVPVSVPFTYPWPSDKDWQAARRRFLWLGSGGLVHKGLDVVLEAFAGMPELELTVCGPMRGERDFEREYFRELYRTPNIRTLGWIDVESVAFRDLARHCGALVYPSCAEGGGSSALTCMHAGMAALLTREASVDLDPSWSAELPGWSVEEVRSAVRELAARPADELEALARAGWDFARRQHTREHFQVAYRRFAESVVEGTWRDAAHLPSPRLG